MADRVMFAFAGKKADEELTVSFIALDDNPSV